MTDGNDLSRPTSAVTQRRHCRRARAWLVGFLCGVVVGALWALVVAVEFGGAWS